ncbi:hypothetical protein PI93_014920 [Pandoraea fibrosis]|uniref:Inositolphosphotransferase Aur1/Ipt1 domain-containing protein n=1 Tax=Pandoraea fibrosis TaxID=1891094 RepID=A0ABX6HSE2_9BURK|nr:phosphatase PAP2 family protein [Pandoraea fibrosis]QHE92652.1 hypothetical protein PJ20_013080 [Pandoraea fibrosis]QHF13791.1 hypothetical protein PI93_014920 [Pandoraea fibrosis]
MNEIDAVTTSGNEAAALVADTRQASNVAVTVADKASPLLVRLFLQPRFRIMLALLVALLTLDVIATHAQGLTLSGLDRVLWLTPTVAMAGFAHLLARQPASSLRWLWEKASAALFCLSLLTVFSLAAVVLQNTAITAHFDLVDDRLVQIDASLGFHWHHTYQWLKAHAQAFNLLGSCYQLYGWQVALIPVLLVCTRRIDDLADYFLLFSVIVMLTILISAIVPASNPHIHFGYVGPHDTSEWSQFAALRDGALRVIDLNDNQGLISLPSLHAAHAVMFVYVVRHLRGWNVGLAVVNVTMTIAALPFGGHYLIDILAGIALAIAVIWASRRMGLRRYRSSQSS